MSIAWLDCPPVPEHEQVETSISKTRLRRLNSAPVLDTARYVLYAMQHSMRVQHNPALIFAIEQANRLALPLRVVHSLDPETLQSSGQAQFFLQGLHEVRENLAVRGIEFQWYWRTLEPQAVWAQEAALVVCDLDYLQSGQTWREHLAQHLPCALYGVEGEAVVPIALAANKAVWSARSLRNRLNLLATQHLAVHLLPHLRCPSYYNLAELPSLSDLGFSPHPYPLPQGGESAAQATFARFKANLTEQIHHYTQPNQKSLPSPHSSGLSPYLHFGHISASDILLSLPHRPLEQVDRFREELLVRRELSFNYCAYQSQYQHYSALPTWARQTLAQHAADPRPFLYSLEQLEQAQTHDPDWNAAQTELLRYGSMRNHMRMYWGKKVLEWTADPEIAFQWLLTLNNRYQLDGSDPNSYAGVAWCFGLHDRPWTPRAIFGTVRYMNAQGLQRKFNMSAYRAWVYR